VPHAGFHGPADKPMPDRFCRLGCDFHELIRKGVAKSATERLQLLERVAQHKSLFFKSTWAKYGDASKGTLGISPPAQHISALREDYARMQEMFFGDQSAFTNQFRSVAGLP
jgi:hypothetical protein